MQSRNRSSLAVQIPSQANDKPSWVKVGVIAVVGFAVGVAWPRLAGIRPGPSAPGEATAAASASPARASDAPTQAPETPAAPANVPSPSASPTEAAVPLNNAP